MNHIPPYLFRSQEDDDDVRDIGEHNLRSVLLHPMLFNANRTEVSSIVKLVGLSTITSSFTGSWSSAISFFFISPCSNFSFVVWKWKWKVLVSLH